MPKEIHPDKPGEGGKPPLPPALERKLRRRAKDGRPAPPPAAQQPPRGGPAKRAVRHQGR